MLDIGMMEIFVIGALALIVVGPKELPGLLRSVGQFAAKARGMAREFQRTMEDAAREADLGDVADVVKGKGDLNKLPFDNQIVDSMKEFEKSVKSELSAAETEARTEANEIGAAHRDSDGKLPWEREQAKAETTAEPKADEAPAADAKPAAKKTAAKKTAAGKTATKKPTAKKPAAKAPGKKAAAAKTAARKAPAKKAAADATANKSA